MSHTAVWKRTHTCGELRGSDAEKTVILSGWVHTWRNHGGVIFINLRDRYGISQLVFNPDADSQLWKKAEKLRHEFVVSVKGLVALRPENMINTNMPTGEIEVVVSDLIVYNEAEPLPVQLHNDELEESEETRLRYRYLDLRRLKMQKNLLFRHSVVAEVRKYLWEENFVEIETPILMKSTPEGARDFLVPSRLNKGKFYALPQSPQTYKQILMVSGYDRYFQVARCFRDEDLRADRQLEFTQIDAELSFVNEEDIYTVFDRMIERVFKQTLNVDVKTPIPRMDYATAFYRYGSDKPDLRFDLPIYEVTEDVKNSEFKVLSSVIKDGGRVGAIAAPGGAALSRKKIDVLTAHVAKFGARGLIWLRVQNGKLESPTAKFFSETETARLLEKTKAAEGAMIFLIASSEKICFTALGQLRLKLGHELGLIDRSAFCFTWVTGFPLFEYSEEQDRYVSVHHPFTAPMEEDLSLLDDKENYFKARSRAYDLVLNGNEIGGGSIRIHSSEIQKKVFTMLGISAEEASEKFGFLLNAFRYGAPPHGGLAFGLDRMVMIMLGLESIRDVIPFPKTTAGLSLMADSPSTVSDQQLEELGLSVNREDD